MAAAARGVYWVGADGNVYTKAAGQNGVANLGNSGKLGTQSFDALNGLTEIADPNAPKPTVTTPAPGNSNGTAGSGSSAADIADSKSNDISTQLSNISGANEQKTSGMSAVDKALAELEGEYDTEAGQVTQQTTAASNQNTNNLQKNKEVALVNAAQGRQGLYGTLSSLGALNGSGVVLANRAVQAGANEDLSGAQDTYDQNSSGINQAATAFTNEDAARRKQAEDAAANEKTQVQNTSLSNTQKAYQQLASDYSDEGDKANAAKYTALGNGLTGQIADTSVAPESLAYSGAAFTPSTLSNYLAGQGTTVSTTPAAPGQTSPGLVATNPVKKKQPVTT